MPASLFRRGDGSRGVFPHTVTDRAKPGVIAINAAGRRFVNEALSRHEFVLAMLRDCNGEPDRPFYLVCDRQFLWSYGLGRIKPFTLNLRRYVASGELLKAPDIAQLAAKIGVDPSVLTATIAGYNAWCEAGPRSRIRPRQHHLSAPPRRCQHKPNPCVAPILRAPFFAMRIYPADPRHRHRHEGGRAGARAARGRHAGCGSLRLRQRHGVDHERELSGAGDHARAGADVRVYRGAASGGGAVTRERRCRSCSSQSSHSPPLTCPGRGGPKRSGIQYAAAQRLQPQPPRYWIAPRSRRAMTTWVRRRLADYSAAAAKRLFSSSASGRAVSRRRLLDVGFLDVAEAADRPRARGRACASSGICAAFSPAIR